MSISVCTDELVLMLVPKGRITSVSWLARDPALSLMARPAMTVAVNHGLGEEVLRDRPDLIVAGTFTSTATRAMLKRLGWPLLEVGPADSIAAIRATTRQVAAAVGEPTRGEALIAQMDRQLAGRARDAPPPLRVAAWDASGFGAARGSLYDAVLTATGATNLAAGGGRGAPDPEQLLVMAPPLLARGGAASDDLRTAVSDHPVIRRIWGPGRSIRVPQAAYLCGTPLVADSILELRARLRSASGAARTPLAYARRPGR